MIVFGAIACLAWFEVSERRAAEAPWGTREPSSAGRKAGSPSSPPSTAAERLAAIRIDLHAGRVRDAEEKARLLYADTGHSRELEAQVLDVWVEALWRSRRSHEAATLELAQRAVTAKTTLYGPDSPHVVASLLNLVVVHRTGSRHDEGRASGAQALRVLADAGRSRSVQAATVIYELGNIEFMAGDYAKAITMLVEAETLLESIPAAPRTVLANVLNSLAAAHGRSGDFVRARQIHERALEIRLEAFGPEHPKTAETYNNLAVLLSLMGDNATSLRMRQRVVEIRRLNYGPNAPLTLRAQSNLANALRRMGDDESARRLYVDVLEKLAPEPQSKHRALTLAGLGLVEQKMGNLRRALARFVEALEINEQVLGAEHLRVAEAAANVASVRYEMGEFERAEDSCRRALDIRVRAGHQDTPGMAENLVLLAAILAERGQSEMAFDVALQAETVAAAHLAASARSMSRREALQYANVRARGFDLLIQAAIADPNAAVSNDVGRVQRAWDALVKSRALVLEQMARRLRDTTDAPDSANEALRQRWQAATERHAALAFATQGIDSQSRNRELRRARDAMEAAERAWANATSHVEGDVAPRSIGLPEVARALPRDAALVAYAVHGVDEGRVADNALFWLRKAYPRGRQLVALILRRSGPPVAISLGAMRDVDALVGSWAAEAAFGLTARHRTPGSAEQAYRTAGTDLRRAIWDPVQAILGEEKRILIVPEASLHLVTHAALPSASRGYLVDSGRQFHYLAAERDLAANPAAAIGQGVLALGSPDFDTAQVDVAWGALSAPSPRRAAARPATRALQSQCPALDSLQFDPLPNTGREVEELARTWRRISTHGGAARSNDVVLTGEAASAAAFKRYAPGRRILHLATHGFFLGDGCDAVAGTRSIQSRHGPGRRLPESPFLQSGLALAGANNRAVADGAYDDGILTAEEIAAMDLRGVEWAVLSACETGRGEVQAGEGVLGLRRAFQVAGVRSVIMSLWAVSDEATREWMRELYEARLDRRLDTIDAVHSATLHTLRARRDRGTSTHPFYWAGFVGTGDWN